MMKVLTGNQRYVVFIFVTILVVFCTQNLAYGLNVGEPRTVRLFYFLPNDRPYRQEVVDAMKTGILEVQSFYADQMAAHGHGNMTFRIETDAQGVPIVHSVNGDYSDSHYKDRGRPENEISRVFDTSSIVQLVVMDISRSSGGRGTGIKQRGQAIIDGRWDWRTAAHELGHAFGLQHDFRDQSYIMSYGSGRNSLSAGAANYLAVNPYINHSIPLQAGAAPSVQLLSSSQYSYGATSVPVQVRVRDPDGLQQVTLFVKTPEGVNLPTGYNEVVSYHNLSGQTDATVTFNYKGGLPSEGDDDTSLLDQLRHTIYVSAVDKQGNRIDSPSAWTLQPINIQQAKVPVSTRSPRVRDSIYNVVRLFHDRSVSAYDHITDRHLAEIDTLFVNNIHASDSPLQSNDFDGLTGLSRLELRLGSGFSDSSLLPAGIFAGLTSLNSLKFLYYTNIYGDDPSVYPIIPFTVGLKKVSEGQFRVVVPTGVPSNMDLPLIVVNGSINGGAESVTIPVGSVESDILTVTRTPGTTGAVIVDLGRVVPSPPDSSYVFYKSSFHLEMFSPLAGAPTPVSERTPQVLDAIVAAVPEINHVNHDRDLRYMVNGKFVDKKYNMGHYVSEAQLAAITSLDAPGSSGGDLSLGGNWFSLHGDITELKPGDFDGMTNLTKLRLDSNDLSSFPENIFDNLTNLTALNLADNQLSLLPAGLFDNLTNLTTLSLGGNQLSSLPAGIFDQLTNLTNLTLYSNQLISLPAGLFDNLTNLTTLNLLDNPLTQLPEGYFDNLTNLTTLFLPPTITPPPLPGTSEVTPVADRTPQVRDAIVAAAGVNSAADVTAGHLAAITELDLQEENITALKQGDFDNLTNLEGLGIGGTFSSLPDGIFDHLINLDKFALVSTQLSSLPEGICDNLINLTFFAIANTPLSSLPDSLFDNLTKVSTIYLINTQLSSLPDGIFDNLTNMPYIFLYNNQLSSLPSGIFNKATMIVALSNNQLSSLPDGIFKGIFDEPPDLTGTELFGVPLGPISEDQLAELGDYTTVDLTGNLVDPLPLTVSLERVANGQFKAVAPAGAPFNLVLPIRVTNGSINGSAESITIPVGSVESEPLTITRTLGTTYAPTVNIGTLPSLPAGHTGYTLVKSDELPIVFTELGGRLLLPVSARTPEVRDAIVDAIPGVNSAADVTEAHLAAITLFDVSLGSSVKVGDFAGLTGVTQLSLGTGQLTSLPAGLFNDLTGVTVLGLWTRQLTSLPAGLFNDFSNVTYIEWTDEKLITLPVDAFQGFTNLENFGWFAKGLTSLPAGVLDPLTNLTDLEINAPQLNTLPDGIFDNLTNLTSLGCEAGQLTSLPDGIFDQLTNLTRLSFHAGQLTSLPDSIFDQLTNLTRLSLLGSHITSLLNSIKWPTTLTSLVLDSTQLSTLPDGVFAGLPSLTTLILNNNNLTSLPPDIFSELPNLTGLYIRNNQLSTLPEGLFFGLSSLTTLRLDGNAVDPIPLTVSLEKVGDDQFKAVAPAGAPFAIVLPISVTNGSITGGATSITILAGSVESETLTVTRTPGATIPVTVNIGTLPGLPSDHSGYALVKSDDLPITVIEGDITNESVMTLTVGAGPGAALRGYNQHSIPEWDFGSFSPQSFELNDVSYTMYKLTYSVAGKRLQLQTIPHLPGGFALHLDAQQFTSVTALDYNQYTWNNVELDWSDGKTVQIGFITTPPMPPGPPTNLQATPGYEKVTLSWIPPANADPIALPITEYEYRISVDGGNTWDPDWETIGLGRTGHNTLTSCTFGDRNNNSNDDNLIDINLTNGTSYTFEIRARGGDGYSEAARITVVPDGSTPVSERTPQVRDAIVAAVPGVNSASDVTAAHLAAITTLYLSNKGITALKSGDFDGLTALTTIRLWDNELTTLPADIFEGLTTLTALYLRDNELTTLPPDIFDGLTTLTTLYLSNNSFTTLPADIFEGLTALDSLALYANAFTTLPADIFEGLTALDSLYLYANELTTLPAGIFDGLTALTEINLGSNAFTTLPADIFEGLTALRVISLAFNDLSSLPDGIFDGLTALTGIDLRSNAFTSLPEGIFDGLTGIRILWLQGNAVEPLPLNVSLEKVADDQFKAVVPAGAPFEMVLPISITNGSINGGTTSVTIHAGSVESETLKVTRTPDTTGEVTVNIGTLSNLPSNHQGYALVKSTDLPLSYPLPEVNTLIGSRTQQVQDAIIAAIPGVNSASDVTAAHLAAITILNLQSKSITSLKSGDFEGLTALEELRLYSNQISSLPGDIFDGLSALETLNLYNNQLSSLHDGLFEGLTSLTTLRLNGNAVNPIPLIVTLETVAEGQFKAVAPKGAPFDIVLPLTVYNGSITGSATSVTILTGSVESGVLTVTQTAGTTDAVTVNIGTLPALPSDHQGYELVASADLPIEVISEVIQIVLVNQGVCKVGDILTAGESCTYPDTDAVFSVIADGRSQWNIPGLPDWLATFVNRISITDSMSITSTVNGKTYRFEATAVENDSWQIEQIGDRTQESIASGINIPDANLRSKIEAALSKSSGDTITVTEMETLTSLIGQDSSISDLTGLETATNLTTLKLGDNTISDISALASLTNLTELQLWDNQITNLSSLTGLTNLIKLYLWGNNISDISHLSGLTSLTQLRLGENSISNIAAVSSLRNLTYLSVKENAISDISAVSGLTNLVELLIGSNTISDITPVQNLTNLEWLDMPNNSISDISVVQNLTQLVELYFQDNAVSDLSPLVTNSGLGTDDEIDVRGNPLSYLSIYTHIPALQGRNVYVDFDNRVATVPVKISGDTQQGNTGATLTQPFVVEVQDASSVAFAGVPVTFAVTAGGGTLSATNTTTDVNGRAQSTLTLGNTAGTNTVSVSVTGITQANTFTATATAPVVVYITPVSDRTSQVAEAILGVVRLDYPSVSSYAGITTTHLAAPLVLYLNNKSITALKSGDFDGLTNLEQLRLNKNQLTSLPSDIFSGLTSLSNLNLFNNQLSSLPDGIFEGLTSLTTIRLGRNTVNPLPVTVSLEKVAEGQFKVIVPTGALFAITVPISVTNGSITSGASSVTIPKGGVESETLTVTRTAGTTTDVTVDIGTLPSLPRNHYGYALVKSDDLPLAVITSINTAPVFTDGTAVTRTVAENTAAATNIGTLIAATDADNDTLTYTLSGTDASAFDIDSSTGQLKTKAALDYETKSTYTVTITVSDGSLTDTITVTINVTDINEVVTVDPPTTPDPLTTNTAPEFLEGDSTTRVVLENTAAGTNIGNPVNATDTTGDLLAYTLAALMQMLLTLIATDSSKQKHRLTMKLSASIRSQSPLMMMNFRIRLQ